MVLLALLPFAAMCVNAIVYALAIVDSVGFLPFATMCINVIVCALAIVDSVGFYLLRQCASMRLCVHLVSLILLVGSFTLCRNVHQCDCVCIWYGLFYPASQ